MKKIYVMVLFLFASWSVYSMDMFSGLLGQNKGPFPLKEEPFKGKTFESLLADAYKGDSDIIKDFMRRYPQLINHENSNGETLLNYAVYGYINCGDAWGLIIHLMGRGLPLNQTLADSLVVSGSDKEKNKRKTQLTELVNLFLADPDNPFPVLPEDPSTIILSNEEEGFFGKDGLIKGLVGGFGLLGLLVWYNGQGKEERKAPEKIKGL